MSTLQKITAAVLLVLLLGGLAYGLGVGPSTLLMGVVVAALVTFDELQRDRDPRPDPASS